MTIESFLGAIVIGTVIGVLGRLIAPGRQNISILVTIIVGIIAALLGSLIVGSLVDTQGIDWRELLAQLVLAVIGVLIAARLLGNRRRV